MDSLVLREDNFTDSVKLKLKEFENALLTAITKDGWDGVENEKQVQWTFAGALFYSIIVITTIGTFQFKQIKVDFRLILS